MGAARFFCHPGIPRKRISGIERMCGAASAFLAGGAPRGCGKSQGARAPKRCDHVFIEAAFRRPRAAALPCRGCNIDVSGPQVPPGGFKVPGYRRSGPLAAAQLNYERPPLQKGVLNAVASVAQPRSKAPASEASLASRRRCERKATPPQPGTDPAPLQTLSCCVPRMGKMRGSMGGGGEGWG